MTCLGKPALVKWLDSAIRFAVVPYMVLITLITAFCLAGFTMAAIFSSFCVKVDQNVLSLVGVFTKARNLTDVYDLSRFYIEGCDAGGLVEARELLRSEDAVFRVLVLSHVGLSLQFLTVVVQSTALTVFPSASCFCGRQA